MAGRSRKRIYICESKPDFQIVLETLSAEDEVVVSGFTDHRRCLEKIVTRPCDLLIVDLDGSAGLGLDMLTQTKRTVPWIPCVVIVGSSAVSWAIKAVRAGAAECLDKPVPPERLLATVGAQLARVDGSRHRRSRALTPMEVHILRLILAGETSSNIAIRLHRSKRTIDVHRKNIMQKLEVTGLAGLIKRALDLGFTAEHSDDEDEFDGETSGETEADLS